MKDAPRPDQTRWAKARKWTNGNFAATCGLCGLAAFASVVTVRGCWPDPPKPPDPTKEQIATRNRSMDVAMKAQYGELIKQFTFTANGDGYGDIDQTTFVIADGTSCIAPVVFRMRPRTSGEDQGIVLIDFTQVRCDRKDVEAKLKAEGLHR